MNPTQAVFEDRIAALEGGVGALGGRERPGRADRMALLNLAENGGHIVSSASLYGGTYNQLHYTFPKLGIEVSFVDDPDDLDAWRAAIRPNTKAFYGETIGNPKGDIFDFEGVSAIAHDAGIPLVIDNTLASPYLCAAAAAGAPTSSCTRRRSSSAATARRSAAIIVDGGKFDYVAQRSLPRLHRARPELPRPRVLAAARAAASRAVHPQVPAAVPARHRSGDLAVQLVPLPPGPRDAEPAHGAPLAERARGRAVARGARRGRVGRRTPASRRARGTRGRRSTCRNGQGAIVAFGIKGGLEAGQQFVDALELHSHLANVGDVRSLAIHPATTTHQQLEPEEQVTTGVTPDLVRLSVGIEIARRHPRRPRRRLPRREGR